jgi:hypothetical protein
VQLVHGRYGLTLAVFDQTRKRTIVHAFDVTSTDVEGPVGSGPASLVPMQVEARHVAGNA